MYHVISPFAGAGVHLDFGQFIVTYTYAFAQRHDVGDDLVKADVTDPRWVEWKHKTDNGEAKAPQSLPNTSRAHETKQPW